MFASTEVFNRDASLQSAEYVPTVFYSCKDFTSMVGRREWCGNVSPRNFAEKALSCSPEPRSCKSRQGPKETPLLLLHAVLPDQVWPRSSLIGLAYASLIVYTKLA